jgi:hypothetical protein
LPQIKKMLADLDLEAAKVGLKLHPDKTKIQHNSIGYAVGVKEAKCGRIMVEVLPEGEHSSYLGRVINLRDLHGTELHNRIAKAWAKFGVFKGELTDPAIPIHLRTKLFNAVVTPTILYGSEVWTMTLQRQKKLRATQRRMMRQIIQAHRSYDRFENYVDWMKAETSRAVKTMHDNNVECWTVLQRRKTWDWAEKLVSTEGERWNQAVITWHLQGTRTRGRPKCRWHDVMNTFLEKTTGRAHRGNDWQKAASNKRIWRSMAADFEKETSLTSFTDMDE